jgi:hypothetical protein
MWANSSEKDGTKPLISRRSGSGDWWELIQRDNGIRLEVYKGTTQYSTPYYDDYNIGEWNQYIITVDNVNQTAIFYVNNTLIGSVKIIADSFGYKLTVTERLMTPEEKQHFLEVENANWKGGAPACS